MKARRREHLTEHGDGLLMCWKPADPWTSGPIGLLCCRLGYASFVSSFYHSDPMDTDVTPCCSRVAPLGRDPLPWGLVLIVGASALYYAFFTSMFVCVLALVVAIWRRTLSPLGGAAAVCAAIVGTLIVTDPGPGRATRPLVA